MKFSQSQINSISRLYDYKETDESELLKSEDEAKELQQINYDDKIKLLKQQNDSFSAKKTLLDAKSGDESNIKSISYKISSPKQYVFTSISYSKGD